MKEVQKEQKYGADGRNLVDSGKVIGTKGRISGRKRVQKQHSKRSESSSSDIDSQEMSESMNLNQVQLKLTHSTKTLMEQHTMKKVGAVRPAPLKSSSDLTRGVSESNQF